jgi:hypothetical protein
MSTTTSPDWLNINEASLLCGKSISTLRRLLPEIEASGPEHIRREPIEGKGGERILLSRAYILERFNVKEPEPQKEEERALEGMGLAQIVATLERELAAKNRQIEHYLRDGESKNRQIEELQIQAGELSERLTQFAAINAGLQNKLLALTERAGEPSPHPVANYPESKAGPAWYSIGIAVLLSLIGGLLLWLILLS